MIQNLDGVTIKGGCFERETDLVGLLQYPINIVYGQNGVGKSTIGRAIQAFKEGSPEYEVSFLDFNGASLTEEINPERIFVFNEDFVRKNVLVQGDELGSIVMLGKQVAKSQNITVLKNELTAKKTAANAIATELNGDDKLDIVGLVTQSKALKEKVNQDLRKDVCGWKNRELLMTKKERVSKVLNMDSLLAAKNSGCGYSADINLVSDKVLAFITKRQGAGDSGSINWNKPSIGLSWLNDVQPLLQKVVARPRLSAEELQVAKVAREYALLGHTDTLVLKGKMRTCPLCYQAIGEAWLDELQQKMGEIRNDAIRKVETEIDAFKARVQYVPDLTLPEDTTPTIKSLNMDVRTNMNLLNKEIDGVRNLLDEKKNSLHDAQSFDKSPIEAILDVLEDKLSRLEQEVTVCNLASKDVNTYCRMNVWLTYLQNQNNVDTYEALVSTIDKKRAEKVKIDAEIALLENELKVQNQGSLSTEEAMNAINENIANIFWDRNRIELSLADSANGYVLRTRGKSVSPRKISVGERNILALAYFFASVGESQTQNMEQRYNTPLLMVVDDPVSSFDIGNRAGVMSFLQKEMAKLVRANENSKYLILTHDSEVVHNVSTKRYSIFHQQAKRNGWDRELKDWGSQFLCYENGERVLVPYEESASEYKEGLKLLCNFSYDVESYASQYRTIGNQVRQVLEHFSSMVYNMDWQALIENEGVRNSATFEADLLDDVQKSRLKDAVADYLNRQVVNAQSHGLRAGRVYTKDEVRMLAKKALYLLYMLNPGHLHSYLWGVKIRGSFAYDIIADELNNSYNQIIL